MKLDRRDAGWLALLLLAGGGARAFYLSRLVEPVYDPWRHLALIRNLREGLGFTLFEGQPYVWYQPVWHTWVAWLPTWLGPATVAGLISWMLAPVFYLVLRRADECRHDRTVPAAGSLLVALSGPLITFTCHYGPEAMALGLILCGLGLLLYRPGPGAALVAGLLFGVALLARMNFAFNVFLFLPYTRDRRRLAAFVAGTGLPLLLGWWRNHRAIVEHAWLFTWDGLATPTEGFGLLSTLVVQMHPTINQGLRRLHEQVVPWPEWIRGPEGYRPELMLFVLLGALAALLSRRVGVALTVAATLGYFLLLDSNMSSHFFRIYLGLFPAMFWGVALSAGKLNRRRRGIGWAIPCVMLLAGVGFLVPPGAVPLAAVTPPDGLLLEERYLVNSGFFQPEALIYRYPALRFAGLPLDPDQLDRFLADHPDHDAVLLHPFSVQDDVRDALLGGRLGYRLQRSATNVLGRRYRVLSRTGEESAEDAPVD